MKRNENKSNRNRSLVVVLLVAMFAMLLVGCKKPAENPPVPSTSEVISEVVSEEPSEEVSEVVSEEAAPEVEVVKYLDVEGLEKYLQELDKTIFVEYNFGMEGSSQTIVPVGSNYTMQLGDVLGIYSNKEITSVVANVDNIDIWSPMMGNIWNIFINTTGTDIEVSCTIKYADGTEEDVTVYVTIE